MAPHDQVDGQVFRLRFEATILGWDAARSDDSYSHDRSHSGFRLHPSRFGAIGMALILPSSSRQFVHLLGHGSLSFQPARLDSHESNRGGFRVMLGPLDSSLPLSTWPKLLIHSV